MRLRILATTVALLLSDLITAPAFAAAESQTKFAPTAFDGLMEFQIDASGKVTHVIVRQNGRDTIAPRISDLAPIVK